ncbi:MAG TPA: glycosyltransferase, partial [Gammaproteobacteria bacterium]|nr:glycosyltransferase [Gammaproteobacteria bacterium]
SRALVFTGAMDYWPNVDAVCWFVEEVMPRLRVRVEGLRFCIVGARPDERVRRLERHPDVLVTGRVPDVRPYLAHALAAVAPMRVARGVQNKVLEAMAMARPVLVSPQGLDGIEAAVGEEVLLGETPDAFAGHVLALLAGEHARMGAAARRRVLQDFNWDRSLPSVTALLDAEEAA